MSNESFEFKTTKEKDWLKGLLRETTVDITFTKKDGSERVKTCTLQEQYIPEIVGDVRKKSEDSLAVFDLEKEDWRAFRWDSVKSVKFSLGEANA